MLTRVPIIIPNYRTFPLKQNHLLTLTFSLLISSSSTLRFRHFSELRLRHSLRFRRHFLAELPSAIITKLLTSINIRKLGFDRFERKSSFIPSFSINLVFAIIVVALLMLFGATYYSEKPFVIISTFTLALVSYPSSLSDVCRDLSYNIGLTGSLPPNIGQLAKLTILILIGCGFSGTIPDSIGSLQQLTELSLNSNKFSGQVPASIGNLKELYWLDLSDNKLIGSIPVSDGTNPGLGLLVNAKHFHFGINQLSGTIPDRLFSSDTTLIHLLFYNNNFTGMIPSTLGLVQTLQAVRLDRNKLGGHIPSNLKDLTDDNEFVLCETVS